MTLTKSGLKSLLVEAEFCDDFLSDVTLDQECDVVRKKIFDLLFFQGALNQIRTIQKLVIREQTVHKQAVK